MLVRLDFFNPSHRLNFDIGPFWQLACMQERRVWVELLHIACPCVVGCDVIIWWSFAHYWLHTNELNETSMKWEKIQSFPDFFRERRVMELMCTVFIHRRCDVQARTMVHSQYLSVVTANRKQDMLGKHENTSWDFKFAAGPGWAATNFRTNVAYIYTYYLCGYHTIWWHQILCHARSS